MYHFQGIFVRYDHQGNRDRKRGLAVNPVVLTTKSLHSVDIFAHRSLAFDLLALRDLAH